MSRSTISPVLLASPFASCHSLSSLTMELLPLLVQLGELIGAFMKGTTTPATAHVFETALERLLRDGGRVIVAWVYNRLEPEDPNQAAPTLSFEGSIFRRRDRSPRRFGIATLFGIIALWRIRYEPWDAGLGLASISPLEMRLGIVGGKATPALANRVGVWTAQYTQETVRHLLAEEHGVSWSVDTLRKVAADLSNGLAPLCHDAQVQMLLSWLQDAQDSQGPHRPVLSVGRDGMFLPIAKDTKYREGATATVAVLDRRGKRLGTVYLGHMPEPGQGTLTQQLTELLRDVLNRWQGPLPRLQYVTDAGDHPTKYFETVLQPMLHPRTNQKLQWEWVLDYYHACLYLTKMAEALFGKDTREAASWAAKMRRWLRDKSHGIFRVLHSAAAHAARLEWLDEDRKRYDEAYAYLRQRMHLMDYCSYRRRGLAIGSGITEAACKILFTQRFKQSGMKWSLEGGQVVVDLRVIWLSKVWDKVFASYLRQLPQVHQETKDVEEEISHEMAA
jgi:hypothetical protein